MQLELVEVGSDAFRRRADESFALFKKYQETVHKVNRRHKGAIILCAIPRTTM